MASTPKTASTTTNATIAVGSTVMLEGLVSKPHLNGRVGDVSRILPDGRVGVRLRRGLAFMEPISLKRSNLVHIPGAEMLKYCATCKVCKNLLGKNYLQKCANCRRERYCSKVCQTSDWAKHKTVCNVLRISRKETDDTLPSLQNVHDRIVARSARMKRYATTGKLAEAEQEQRRLIEEFSLQYHVFYATLARIISMQGRYDEALDIGNQALQMPLWHSEEPAKYSETHCLIGSMFRDMGDLPRAKDAYEAAFRFDPDCPEATEFLRAMA